MKPNVFTNMNRHAVSYNFFKKTIQNEKEAELASHTEILNQSALVTISDLKGNILHANELFCRVSKYSIEEILYKPHSIIRHPDTPSSVFKEMWSTIGNGNVWKGEIKNKAKDGSDYWVIATIAPVLGTDGKPIKYISIRYDITKQKEAEAELIQAKKKIDLKPVFVKTHSTVYRSVIGKDAFAGGGVNNTLDNEAPEVRQQLRVLYETPAYTPHPIATHPSVPAAVRERFLKAMLKLTQDDEGRKLLDGINLSKPQAVTYAKHYKPLESLQLEKFLVLTGQ